MLYHSGSQLGSWDTPTSCKMINVKFRPLKWIQIKQGIWPRHNLRAYAASDDEQTLLWSQAKNFGTHHSTGSFCDESSRVDWALPVKLCCFLVLHWILWSIRWFDPIRDFSNINTAKCMLYLDRCYQWLWLNLRFFLYLFQTEGLLEDVICCTDFKALWDKCDLWFWAI